MHGTVKIQPKRNFWRKSRTLTRRVSFRPIEEEDIRWAWAAYRLGALKDMSGPFAKDGMTATEFEAEFRALVPIRYHGAWTLFADTKRGNVPVGMVFAFLSHAELSPFMIVGDIAWFPWASTRNKIEAAVHFFNSIRSTVPLVEYAHGEVRMRFFEMLCQHAVMRRVGTTFNVVKGEPVGVFETRVG